MLIKTDQTEHKATLTQDTSLETERELINCQKIFVVICKAIGKKANSLTRNNVSRSPFNAPNRHSIIANTVSNLVLFLSFLRKHFPKSIILCLLPHKFEFPIIAFIRLGSQCLLKLSDAVDALLAVLACREGVALALEGDG